MTQIKVVAMKYTSAGEATGRPYRIQFTLPTEIVSSFPKSARIKWGNVIDINFGSLNATTGAVNEASIKRYRSVMKLIDKNGWDMDWVGGERWHMTRDELEAAL